MFAVVEYNNYRKEQNFKVITFTEDVEYAKKIAFNNAKKDIPKDSDSIYKITNDIEECHLYPVNKTIINYSIISVEKYKNGFKINYSISKVYSVIEMEDYLKKESIEKVDDIDESLLCNSYYSYYMSEDEECEEEEVDDDQPQEISSECN
jgi:hypothetical protein